MRQVCIVNIIKNGIQIYGKFIFTNKLTICNSLFIFFKCTSFATKITVYAGENYPVSKRRFFTEYYCLMNLK